MIVDSALGLIENTPLIELKNIYDGLGRLFGEAEFIQLVKGQSVVEMTSGNMGAGLAVVCNQLGNPFTAVMSSGNSPQRVKMMESLGATVNLVAQVDQFNNPSCVDAHFCGTGAEIWQDLGDTMTAFVAAVGTGGTFVGCSRYLKQQNSNISCVAVEPS
jgi:cysteine synthase A